CRITWPPVVHKFRRICPPDPHGCFFHRLICLFCCLHSLVNKVLHPFLKMRFIVLSRHMTNSPPCIFLYSSISVSIDRGPRRGMVVRSVHDNPFFWYIQLGGNRFTDLICSRFARIYQIPRYNYYLISLVSQH